VNGTSARIPLATYRLQFNSRFTFADARAIVDYLRALGISDVYASPYLMAVPGSSHGYDVADPTRLNPEVGDTESYDAWVGALAARGMGHVVDLVPNHVGIAKSANPWWLDVLENGPSSRFARFFDIDWRPVKAELADKVLIPILGDQYGEVLERRELVVEYRDGGLLVRYHDWALPIAPDTYGSIFEPELDAWLRDHPGGDAEELQSVLTAARNLPGRSSRDDEAIAVRAREKEIVKRRLRVLAERSADIRELIARVLWRINGIPSQPHSFDALDRLLNEQSYRLAHWRVASEEINYRRFFDINDLAAVRMEDPAVFEEAHRFVFELVGRGAVTGLRIDHVDGLYAPGDYLRRLQARAGDVLGVPSDQPLYVLVEKILARNEDLPRDWPVRGTTGYEFAAMVTGLFIDCRNERALDAIYARFVRREREPFDDHVYRAKKQVMHETMSGDINALGHQLNTFSERNRHFRDFTLYSLISTLKEVIACFPVYRTYISAGGPVSDRDRGYIAAAIRCATDRARDVTTLLFDFVGRLLLKDLGSSSVEECEARTRIIGKFQQITSPVAAKGIEDAALYLYNRLIALNEVGADPTRFGVEPDAVHAWMAARQREWPHALSATSTHDTKRGEDVRARISVLSEIPGAWKAAVARWRMLNRRFKTELGGHLAPSPNEEYFLYQTLLGAWPFESDEDSASQFRQRIGSYMVKALREAKTHSSWLNPTTEYELAVTRFIEAILDCRRGRQFLDAFLPFQARVAELGIYNSLGQVLIKTAAPGVPDFYQGGELWDLSLVDPDNRHPVDYARRRTILSGIECTADVDALFGARNDGRIKLFVIARALATRASRRDLFEKGEYEPLETTGARRRCVFAFARRFAGRMAVVCVPRLVSAISPDAATPPLGAAWHDTRIALGAFDARRPLVDVLTGAEAPVEDVDGRPTLGASTLFARLPVALLVDAS
jgi:(1->4)-alpha-D-glucan 1-alpha-D-glucosylmutase